MSIQTDLRAATEAIIHARGNVARYEIRQAKLAHYYNRDEAALAVAHRALMSRSDAGSNEAQRRAFADRETAADRDRLANTAAELLDVEAALINMKCELAQAVDRRRLLETLAQLTIAGVGEAEAAENGNGERYTLADANRDMF